MKFRVFIQRIIPLQIDQTGIVGVVEYGTVAVNDIIAIENSEDKERYVSEIKINGQSVQQAAVGNKVAIVLSNCSATELEGVRHFSNSEDLKNKNAETWSNQWVDRYTTQKAEEKKREELKLTLKNIFKRKSIND